MIQILLYSEIMTMRGVQPPIYYQSDWFRHAFECLGRLYSFFVLDQCLWRSVGTQAVVIRIIPEQLGLAIRIS